MLAGRGHWGYPIPQYRKKNWEIPKYRVKNRRNTDTAFIFGHAYLKLYPSRVFVYLKDICGYFEIPYKSRDIKRDLLAKVSELVKECD